jgi:hypothetical protein
MEGDADTLTTDTAQVSADDHHAIMGFREIRKWRESTGSFFVGAHRREQYSIQNDIEPLNVFNGSLFILIMRATNAPRGNTTRFQQWSNTILYSINKSYCCEHR